MFYFISREVSLFLNFNFVSIYFPLFNKINYKKYEREYNYLYNWINP